MHYYVKHGLSKWFITFLLPWFLTLVSCISPIRLPTTNLPHRILLQNCFFPHTHTHGVNEQHVDE